MVNDASTLALSFVHDARSRFAGTLPSLTSLVERIWNFGYVPALALTVDSRTKSTVSDSAYSRSRRFSCAKQYTSMFASVTSGLSSPTLNGLFSPPIGVPSFNATHDTGRRIVTPSCASTYV